MFKTQTELLRFDAENPRYRVTGVIMIRGLILLSFMGLLLVACGDKDDDTGADTAEVADTANDDTATQ